MSAMINLIGNEARVCFEEVKSGKCFKTFSGMSGKKQLETIGKVALVAFLTGLLTSCVVGAILGSVFALTAGFGAFAYLTNSRQHGQYEISKDLHQHAKEQFGYRSKQA